MKRTLYVLPFLLFGGHALAQNAPIQKLTSTNATVEICNQHIRSAQMQIDDPARFATIDMQSHQPYQAHYVAPGPEKATGIIYTIPVVFHILHNNGSENISDAQVNDAIAVLNRDYRRLNADADQVNAPFIGMPTDVEVEFVLATVAPNGNCFNGITRTVTTLTNNGSNGQNQVNAVIAGNDVFQGVWAHNKYLNIYVAADIGGAAGYTFLPNGNSTANATNMYYNGIFVLDNYCGSIGTSSVYRSRTLTHEVGHWLNLPHVWGAGNSPGSATNCNGDDGVQDTPNCTGVSSCNLNSNTCNSDDAYWGTAMVDNVENYMDYSYCSKMFTNGQVTRMRTALTNSVGGRSNIITIANLQSVGAMPGTSLCAIDFTANETTVCAGTVVTYTPNTTSGISAFSWSFPGGTPATSSATNPTVTYNTVGNHNATLTVTSSSNGQNYAKSKTNYMLVNSNNTVNLPISEGFTNAGTPAGWTIVNTNASTTWTRTTAAGFAPTTGNSFMFDNYNVNDATNDEFRPTQFSTTGMSSAQLTFDVAYAPYNTSNFDGLEVLVSTDCGSTFTSVYLKMNTVLATRTATTSLFTPTAAQWRAETIDLSAFVGQGSVLVSFKNIAGYGNRLFVDNINITGVSSAATANFNASSSTACAGQTVTFTNTSVGATSWNWNFGAGASPATATGAGPHAVTYSTSGTKSVSLSINSGASVSNQNVTINAIPATPTINAGGATTFCTGGSVTLTSSSASGNQWSLNGSPIGGATNQNYTANAAGNYTVTTTTSVCPSSPSNATTVTVNPTPSAPSINAGGATTFCAGGSVTLTASSVSGNQWSLNGSPIGGATNQNYTATAAGSYTVTTTTSGCPSPASNATTVTVNPIPSAPSINAGGATTFCTGGSVTLTASSASGNQWSLNGSPIVGATNQNYVASSTGNYTVTTTASGCSSSASAVTTVTVNPNPSINLGTITDPTACGTATGSIQISGSGTGTVNWSGTASGSSGSVTLPYTITGLTAGSYTITFDQTGCTSNSLSQSIIDPSAPSAPTINASGTTMLCEGQSLTLTSSAATGNQWSLNGSPISGATNQSLLVTATGNYTVSFVEAGCTSQSSSVTSVTVHPLPVVTFGTLTDVCINSAPVTLSQGSPSGGIYSGTGVSGTQFNPATAGVGNHTLTYTFVDGNNCSNSSTSSIAVDACAGIDEQNEVNIAIYPNPSNGLVVVKGDGILLNKITVYNQIGQIVLEQHSTNESEEINLMDFADGIYTLTIDFGTGVKNSRIVLSK